MRRTLLCLLLSATLSGVWAQKDCRQQEYKQLLISTSPRLSDEYSRIEKFTKDLILSVRSGTSGTGPGTNAVPDIIVVPVVVHILWNDKSQNITDQLVLSQIEALNNDYAFKNVDKNKIPFYFQPFAAACGIRFELAKMDPQGRPTNGIIHKQTGTQYFAVDDRMKSSAIGGDDGWDADSYLNIWVCNTAGGILGYSSIPGDPKEKDGVVISTSVFGTLNKSGAFNKGRTTVHEIGHWLNLRHTWGDAYCGDDMVADTPPQASPTRGCPNGERFTCGSTEHGDMYMNYMDFTDDACMFMFTSGQRERMRALFEMGGPRQAILSSKGLSGAGLPVQAPGPDLQGGEVSIKLYPNPAYATIFIQSKETADCIGKTMDVYNHLGQVIKSLVIQSRQQPLDVSRLPNGIYFIKIAGVETRAMTKFIKQ